MFNISGKKISITRGDSASFTIQVLNTDGTDYPLQEGDELTFTVKKTSNEDDKTVIIQKTGQNISLEPLDTNNLSYGKYAYDVQLVFADRSVNTIIEPSEFNIRPEVTF